MLCIISPLVNPARVCCGSLNRVAKATGFFLPTLLLSPCQHPPHPHPLHPSVHSGTSAEVGRASGSWTLS